ncbi:MAG: aminotransferase class V-fold PLP-dependent enzyme [Candidatus Rokubacteria bacterium]|nr:aminotransferase class V-fold PLP-dependent enzyme [Candidatus Rokubacteria bacterium]
MAPSSRPDARAAFPADLPHAVAHWPLDPAVAFLNHGSFGACPRPVLAAQQRWRDRMEQEPVRFLSRELPGLLAQARRALGAFIGAEADDLAFLPNATSGVNTVLRSLGLAPGDEILVSDHGYNACINAARHAAGRAGARVVVAQVPFPLEAPERVVEAVLDHVTPATRLAVLDHVTSPTGLVFPIDGLVRALATRGIDTLVDGAHAPGMLPLDLAALGAAYYTGNCHKWLCAPKGAAFLHVRRDRQAGIRPLVISHGANAVLDGQSRFRAEFDWTGTDDPSAYLVVPDALRFLETLLPGGWPALMARNRAAALAARDLLAGTLGIEAPAPDTMIGALASVPLPPGEARPGTRRDTLQSALMDGFGVEVPVMLWPQAPARLLRVSCQIYNRREQYDRLAGALRSVLLAR